MNCKNISIRNRIAILSLLAVTALPASAYALEGEEEKAAVGVITVTGTREEEPIAETSATVDVIGGEETRKVKPAHPSEIMDRVPGVWVNVTGGEGHMTSIRHPLTTAPVYLYLEDGVPTRSTGFFNHNALYEVNIPMSGGVEVTKGPGTALYGSDAIGGVVNVLTRPTPLKPEFELNAEGGSYGWARTLLTAGNTWGDHGLRADMNITHTDGWRDATDYDRQSATLRWDGFFSGGSAIKTVITYSNINQQTAGSSRLSREDYENNPTLNYTPISYRDVGALRASAAWEKETAVSLISLTPYYRKNRLGYIANWSLSYDPSILDTENDSFGLMAKYRRDFEPMRTKVIVGADIDHSPGKQFERAIDPAKEGNIYTSYTKGGAIYDYDVAFTGFSPYLHAEASPTDALRVNAGLRYDVMSYDYDNKLSDVSEGSHRRPADSTVNYGHLSPKIGATYAFASSFNGFVSYRHAFRAPSQSQLFRQGKAESTVDLKPVKADSYEAGLRGALGSAAAWEISGYYMTKKDDILSYRHPDGSTETKNAGETLHKGVEAGLRGNALKWLSLAVSLSYAEHTFEDWTPKEGVNYSGNEISSAPKVIANARLGLSPDFLRGGELELEWVRLGEYWMDDENTHKYGGHDLFNLRASFSAGPLDIYGRVMNLADQTWATNAAYSKFRGEEYAPGLPRTFYAGLAYNFK